MVWYDTCMLSGGFASLGSVCSYMHASTSSQHASTRVSVPISGPRGVGIIIQEYNNTIIQWFNDTIIPGILLVPVPALWPQNYKIEKKTRKASQVKAIGQSTNKAMQCQEALKPWIRKAKHKPSITPAYQVSYHTSYSYRVQEMYPGKKEAAACSRNQVQKAKKRK